MGVRRRAAVVATVVVIAIVAVAIGPPSLPGGEDGIPTDTKSVTPSPDRPKTTDRDGERRLTATSRSPSTSTPEVRVVGDLDLNATDLWHWTERALERNVSPPTVEVRTSTPSPRSQRSAGFISLLLGCQSSEDASGGRTAFVGGDGTEVIVYRPFLENSTAETMEAVLVHEFTHVVSLQTDAVTDTRPGFGTSIDEIAARSALSEGGPTSSPRLTPEPIASVRTSGVRCVRSSDITSGPTTGERSTYHRGSTNRQPSGRSSRTVL